MIHPHFRYQTPYQICARLARFVPVYINIFFFIHHNTKSVSINDSWTLRSGMRIIVSERISINSIILHSDDEINTEEKKESQQTRFGPHYYILFTFFLFFGVLRFFFSSLSLFMLINRNGQGSTAYESRAHKFALNVIGVES